MKPYYVFKPLANYLQLTLSWKPTEALCLDVEIIKFIGFPPTLLLEDTQRLFSSSLCSCQITLSSVYCIYYLSLWKPDEYVLLHYGQASQELSRSLGFSTASKALSPYPEEREFCHWLGSEYVSESLACSVLGLHHPWETPLPAPQAWGHISLLCALLQRQSLKTLWVGGSRPALSLHAEIASLAPSFSAWHCKGFSLSHYLFSLTVCGLSNATVFCVSKCHGGWFGFVKRWWKKGNKAASLRAYE